MKKEVKQHLVYDSLELSKEFFDIMHFSETQKHQLYLCLKKWKGLSLDKEWLFSKKGFSLSSKKWLREVEQGLEVEALARISSL